MPVFLSKSLVADCSIGYTAVSTPQVIVMVNKISAHPMIKFTLHKLLASLGKLFLSTPTSVVVPPISTTMALGIPDRNAAPLMLLVGPEEKVRTGYFMASSPLK